MPNLKLVLSFFVCLIMMGIPNVTNSRTVMMGVMNKKCPEGYVLVPPDPNYGSQPNYFCVAKYEMKNDGSNHPVSRAAGTPWTHISQPGAFAACSSLGQRYSLITNDQWQTIARNIAHVGSNWSSGSIGSGYINRGSVYTYTDTVTHYPREADTSTNPEQNPCINFNPSPVSECSQGTWDDNKRTHVLSNNAIIWDFGGNAREWVSTTINPSSIYTGSDTFISTLTSSDGLKIQLFGNTQDCGSTPSNSSPFCGFGKLRVDTDSSSYNGVSRGGGVGQTADDYGIFNTVAGIHPSNSYSNWGFRCVYRIEN